MAYRKRSSYRSRSGSARRGVGRARKTTRRAVRQQPTVKLVIEHVGASPITRPEMTGLKEKPKTRAKF